MELVTKGYLMIVKFITCKIYNIFELINIVFDTFIALLFIYYYALKAYGRDWYGNSIYNEERMCLLNFSRVRGNCSRIPNIVFNFVRLKI